MCSKTNTLGVNKIVEDKMKREILVIKNSLLFENTERKTKFYNIWENDFEEIILKNSEYMQRAIAEENREYKQPIAYWIILNEENKIFVYKRWGADSNAWDKRLHNKIAVWVGWHIEKEEENSKNPIKDTLIREVEEEINLSKENIVEIKNIWYINDDWDKVWEVHIWACYVIFVKNFEFKLVDWEIESWEFISISEYEKMIDSGNYKIETWSKILLEPLKKYLKNK